jgi:TRAP-type uncharacterized transport system fused permease subunit
VIAVIAVHLVFPVRHFGAKVKQIAAALLDSMSGITDIIMIAAAAGLIIGVLNITGISFAITLQMLAVSQHSLALLLALTAVLCIALGLGMPTVGVYILLATLAAPALIELGIAPLAAHFYVLYFGMLSMITPPIAIASFAAATVAGSDPWKTSFASLRVGAGVYLIPVAFVLQPELLFLGELSDTLVAAARLLLSVTLLTAVVIGHVARPLSPALRIGGGVLGVVNILPFSGAAADAVLWGGFALGLGIMALAVRAPARPAIEETGNV